MSFFNDPPLHDFPDRAIRQLQAHPEHLRQLVRQVLPQPERKELFDAALDRIRELALRQEMQTMAQQLEQTWEQELLTQGEARGKLRASKDNLCTVLQSRFGQLPEDLVQQIESIAELERLHTAMERVGVITSLDELRL